MPADREKSMTRFTCVAMLMCSVCLARTDQVAAAGKAATGRTPAGTLKLVPRLAKGDRFILEITKRRTQTGRPVPAGVKGLQVVEVEVIRTDSRGHLLGWTPQSTGLVDADGRPVPMPPQATRLAKMWDGTQLVFELSSDYRLVGLKNYSQVKALMTKMIDRILAIGSLSPRGKAELRRTMSAAFASRQVVEAAFGQGITLLFGLAGMELAAKGAVEFDRQFAMPMGGGVIPARVVVTVTNLDRAAGRATVTMKTRMDPKEATEAMHTFFRAMARKAGKRAPTRQELPDVDIRDGSTFVVDLKTRLPLHVEHTRTTVVGPGKRVETHKIVRKPAGAARPPQTAPK